MAIATSASSPDRLELALLKWSGLAPGLASEPWWVWWPYRPGQVRQHNLLAPNPCWLASHPCPSPPAARRLVQRARLARLATFGCSPETAPGLRQHRAPPSKATPYLGGY